MEIVTTEEKIDGVKIIAKYMGFNLVPHTNYSYQVPFERKYELGAMQLHFDKLQYDCNWKWLMEAVDKIEMIKYNDIPVVVEIALKQVKIYCKGNKSIHVYKIGYSKIESCFLAVVDFIQYLNVGKYNL